MVTSTGYEPWRMLELAPRFAQLYIHEDGAAAAAPPSGWTCCSGPKGGADPAPRVQLFSSMAEAVASYEAYEASYVPLTQALPMSSWSAEGSLMYQTGPAQARNEVELEDATSWEVRFFAHVLPDLACSCPRSSELEYHYTNVQAAEAILLGQQGIRESHRGYRGGGVSFSKAAPTDIEELEDLGCHTIWSDAFPTFRPEQLLRNYGSDPNTEHLRNVERCWCARSQ